MGVEDDIRALQRRCLALRGSGKATVELARAWAAINRSVDGLNSFSEAKISTDQGAALIGIMFDRIEACTRLCDELEQAAASRGGKDN